MTWFNGLPQVSQTSCMRGSWLYCLSLEKVPHSLKELSLYLWLFRAASKLLELIFSALWKIYWYSDLSNPSFEISYEHSWLKRKTRDMGCYFTRTWHHIHSPENSKGQALVDFLLAHPLQVLNEFVFLGLGLHSSFMEILVIDDF